MESLADGKFRFEDFELDCAKRVLKRNGQPVALKSKTFDLLQHLVENHGKLITKTELMEHVWPDQFVEENNLTVQISALRKVFGDGFIKTVSGKGYKFIADVWVDQGHNELVIEQHSVSRITIEEHRPANHLPNVAALPWIKLTAVASIIVFLGLGVFGFVYLQKQAYVPVENYKLSKLTSTGDITSATITPDGSYAVFARKELAGESLWLRKLTSGTPQQIAAPKPIRYIGLAVTQDNRSIFATVFSPDLPDTQIWNMPLLGGEPRVVGDATAGTAVSFSPDGSRMTYTESHSSMRETQLLVSNIDGTAEKVLSHGIDGQRSFPIFNSNPAAWSPDGRLIAAAVELSGEGVKYGIILVDPESGTEKYATDRRWDVIDHLTWLDPDTLAFIGYTIDPWVGQIWTVSRSSGDVRQLTNDLSSYSWLSYAGGKLLTVQRNSSYHIAINDLDVNAGTTLRRDVRNESTEINQVAFAPDGSILFGSSASGSREIWKMRPEGGDAQQLTSSANITFGLTISPTDGTIVFGASENGRHLLKAADADGRNIRLLTNGPEDVNPVFSRDGRSVIYQQGLNNKTITLGSIGLDTGKSVQLTRSSAIKPALSPDGTKLAYYFMDQTVDSLWKIGIASAEDGTFLYKLSFPKPVTERQMKWLSDGSIIGQIDYEGNRTDLLLLQSDSTEAQRIENVASGEVQSMAVAPNGNRIAISYSVQRPDLVVLTR